MVVALVGGVVALDQRGEAGQQAARAEAEERVATARELAASSVSVVDDDPELGILLALEAIERTREPDGAVLPEAEAALHRAVTSSRIVLRVPDLGGSVDWHPDGRLFVTEGPEESGLVDLRDATTGESVLAWTGHDADVNDVAFSPDGSLLATSGDDGLLRVWDTATGMMEAELAGIGVVWGVTFSPDGSKVAAGWVDQQQVRVLDVTTGEMILRTEAATDVLADPITFGPDGQRLAIADWRDGVLVIDVSTGEVARTVSQAFEPIAVAWSPDGRWLAWSAARGVVRISDANGADRHMDLADVGDVTHLDWSPDSTHLATGGRDGNARVWEVADDGVSEVLALAARADQGAIGGLAFSPDGEHVLTGDVRVNAASIWEVGSAGGAEWANMPTSPQVQGTAMFVPNGDAIVATGHEASATQWDVATSTPLLTFGDEGVAAVEIEVSPDGELVATLDFSEPPRIQVWDRRTGERAFTIQEDGVNPQRMAWSPDGELLAASMYRDGAPGRIVVVDRTGAPVTTVVEDATFVALDLAFLPDGRRLVAQRQRSDREDPTVDGVRVWDWTRGVPLVGFPVFAGTIALSPDGTRLAVAEIAGSGSVWDVASGERVATLTGHTGDVSDVVFSPDGDSIATAGADGTVRLWTTESGNEVLALYGHADPVWSVDFGPDGDRLVSTGGGVARVWALDVDDLIGIAEDRLTRSLSDPECRQYLHVDTCPA